MKTTALKRSSKTIPNPEPSGFARPICWLCEIEIHFGAPKDELSGKVIHSGCRLKQDIAIDALLMYASPRGLRFTYRELAALSIVELNQRIAEIKAMPEKPKREHFHTCWQCGKRIECYRDGCTQQTSECRPCHEGMSEHQYAQLSRRSF